MKRLLLALGALVILAGPAVAADSVDARRAAAHRYAATFDFPRMMGDSINQMALALPAEHRSAFVQAMNENMDFTRLEELTIGMMIELFTVEELNALADFYERPIGRSILAKMPKMMGAMTPIIQEQMARTLERAQKREKERQKQGKPM